MQDRRAFSVAIFARHRGRVLLIHHKRLATWLPVGGEVEAGETPLEAAARELREETGLVGTFVAAPGTTRVTGTPAGLLAYEEHAAGSKGLHLNFCFVADVATDEIVGDDSFGAHRWVDTTAGLDCPPNVHELVALALAAPRAIETGVATSTNRGAATTDAPDALRSLARAWLAAFNERSLDRLLALYADDARHFSPKLFARRPETNGLVIGQAALREWWADCFARLPGLHYAERSITTAGDSTVGRFVIEYERTVPGEAPLAVAEAYTVRGGRIAESRVYHG